jgi:hypothetical protein
MLNVHWQRAVTYASSLTYSQSCSYSVTITTEPEAMEGSSCNFSNVNPLLPPVIAIVRPYVLSGIQSEVPNDSPDVYDYISIWQQRKWPVRELHLNSWAILRV